MEAELSTLAEPDKHIASYTYVIPCWTKSWLNCAIKNAGNKYKPCELPMKRSTACVSKLKYCTN